MDMKLYDFYETFLRKHLNFNDSKILQKFQSFLLSKQNLESNPDDIKGETLDSIEKIAYIYQYNLCTSSAVAFLFNELLEKNISLLRKILRQNVLNICCFSDGSCAEIVSLLDILINASSNTANYFSINVTVVCLSENWKFTSKKVLKFLESYFPHEKKFEFIAVDVAEDIPENIADVIHNADIVTMIMFLSKIKNCSRKFHAIYKDILRYVRYGSVVLFLDHAFRNLLKPINRYLLDYEILHYRANYFHSLQLRAVEEFYRTYHLYFKNSLCLTSLQISFGAWLIVDDSTLQSEIFNSIGDRHFIMKTEKVLRKNDEEVFFYEGPNKTKLKETKMISYEKNNISKSNSEVTKKRESKTTDSIDFDKILYCKKYAKEVTDFLKKSKFESVNNFQPPALHHFGIKSLEIPRFLTSFFTTIKQNHLSNLRAFLSTPKCQFYGEKLEGSFTEKHNEFRLLRQEYWHFRVREYEQHPSDAKLAELIMEGDGLAILKQIAENIGELERKLMIWERRTRRIENNLDEYEFDYINLFVKNVSEFLNHPNPKCEFVLPLFIDHPDLSDFYALNEINFRIYNYHKQLKFFRLLLSTENKCFRGDKLKYSFTEKHNEVRLMCEALWLSKTHEFLQNYPAQYKPDKLCVHQLLKLIAQGKGLAVLKAFVENSSIAEKHKLIEGRIMSVYLNCPKSKTFAHFISENENGINVQKRQDPYQATIKKGFEEYENEKGETKEPCQNISQMQRKLTKGERKRLRNLQQSEEIRAQREENHYKTQQKIANTSRAFDTNCKLKNKKDPNQNTSQMPRELTKAERKHLRMRQQSWMTEKRKRDAKKLQRFEQKLSEEVEQSKRVAAAEMKNYTKSLDELLKRLSEQEIVETEVDFDGINYEQDYEIPSLNSNENYFLCEFDYLEPKILAFHQSKAKNKQWSFLWKKWNWI